MIHREALYYLEDWRHQDGRKPLIIRGARQVGKTTLVNDFGDSFGQYLYFNIERAEHKALFEEARSVDLLVRSLFFFYGLDESKEDTLIFIDEIQESSKAIGYLRYFFEDYPQYKVIAAGSLLEFALARVKGFPVGRVEYMMLYPMNFIEFLTAIDRADVADMLKIYPVEDFAHKQIRELFNEYLLIGGMPEVVALYAKDKSRDRISKVYDSILQGYFDDVEKYENGKGQAKLIQYIISHAPTRLNERITFQNFNNTNYKSREVGEAFRSLEKARLLGLVYPSTSTEVPASPDMKKHPRLQFLDTGLGIHRSQLFLEAVKFGDLQDLSRGKLVEHIVGQELLSIHHSPLYTNRFWTREKGGSAECDLVYQYGAKLIPIEVKAGKTGKLRSLFAYMDRCDHQYAIRIYGGSFLVQDAKTIEGKTFKLMNIPYYLGTQIPMYIENFVNNY